jgi:hypothetical protein
MWAGRGRFSDRQGRVGIGIGKAGGKGVSMGRGLKGKGGGEVKLLKSNGKGRKR